MLPLLLLLLILSGAHGVLAQELEWSPMERVPGHPDESFSPLLLTDRNNTVHAFNEKVIDKVRFIIYSQWTAEKGWSIPTDIMLGPEANSAKLGSVVIDSQDVLHLAFFSGNERSASLYYASAHAADAQRASAWSAPRRIGSDALVPPSIQVAVDEQDNLLIVYGSYARGIGLYQLRSANHGKTWTQPDPISLIFDADTRPVALYQTVDPRGEAHYMWSITDETGNSRSVHYTRIDIDSGSTNAEQLIALEDGYEADWPSLAVQGDEIMVIYQNGQPATRWMQRSADYGQTWSDPVRPFPYVGEYGHAQLITDGIGTLHMVLGNRTDDSNHGMWYSTWDGNSWSDLTPIVRGALVRNVSEGAFDPQRPQVVLVGGDTMLVVWNNDNGFNGSWFAHAKINAPVIAPMPYIEQTDAEPAVAVEEVSISAELETPIRQLPTQAPPAPNVPKSSILYFGVLPALLFVIVAIAVRQRNVTRFG